jgi:hypothetical protein
VPIIVPPLKEEGVPLPTPVVTTVSDKVALPSTPAVEPPAELKLVNSKVCSLDYAFDGAGAVEKVEFWMTWDGGKTWESLGEDPDRKSPMEVRLPGDGVFGIVARNGGGPPAKGDVPDWRIEVDTVKPTVTEFAAAAGTGDEKSSVLIGWAATDKNLGPDAAALSYAAQPDGPWVPIARGLPGAGQHRWKWTGPAPAQQVYLRLEVTDKAGNVTRQDTRTPVVLEQPRARIRAVGVSPVLPK